MVRQVMDTYPPYRGLGFIVFGQLRYLGSSVLRAFLYIIVTVHTGTQRRYVRLLAPVNAGVAVLALDTVLACVYFMVEFDRLFRCVVDLCTKVLRIPVKTDHHQDEYH